MISGLSADRSTLKRLFRSFPAESIFGSILSTLSTAVEISRSCVASHAANLFELVNAKSDHFNSWESYIFHFQCFYDFAYFDSSPHVYFMPL